MTQWQEFPRRPQGRAWVGLNTRSGVLDDGSGQMKDETTNAMINEGDVLEKRPGFVRGLDEFFDGAVCGLHRYTDECGIEWLLVSDQAGIKVRQPFAVPVFELSDAYPSDSFSEDGVLDPTRWLNRDPYQQLDGELRLRSEGSPDPVVWFKEAASSSYQLEIQYAFDEDYTALDQQIDVILKARDSTATTQRIEARLVFNTSGAVSLALVYFDSADVSLLTAAGGTSSTGTLRVAYNATNRVVSVRWFPDGGTSFVRDADPLTAVQDADLGQWSALRLEDATASHGILVVSGGPV